MLAIRGATPVRPTGYRKEFSPLTKNPAGDATGEKSQPHSFSEYSSPFDWSVYTPSLDNGGSSGTGYSEIISPYNSKVQSAPAYMRGFHRCPALCDVVSKRTRPLHSFSGYLNIRPIYTPSSVICQEIHE